MAGGKSFDQLVTEMEDLKSYQDIHWEGTLDDYLKIVKQNPKVTRTAFQRIYDMIMSYGTEEYVEAKQKIIRYNFFKDERCGGIDAVFGLDFPLMQLVDIFKSAARNFGTEKRVLLLHGPVGCAKSTLVRLLKKGMEEYSKTPEGALYTYSWNMERVNLKGETIKETLPCPMHEDPLHLIPEEIRHQAIVDLELSNDEFQIPEKGGLCPQCRFIFRELSARYAGDLKKIWEHVRVRRLVLSEKDRVGIGTFQPKDEKNQDSTELTGDINYRKIAEYGSDSDPRAFNFDGEFNIANRGIIEFIEVLKLDVAFLYDLLGASQEHKIKPKKFPQTDIDEVIIGHTNEPEYKKLMSNEFMEALRDRTVKVDIPYITRLNDEIRIYERDYNPERIRGKHIAPHTLEMAATWAVLTRLEESKRHNLKLINKLRLYNGQTIGSLNEDSIKELRHEATREGLEGISPRYIQDKISNALVSEEGEGCINPFMILIELEVGLKFHSLIRSEDQRVHYHQLIQVVKKEYEKIVKNEVRKAISFDEEALTRLCANYLDNINAYLQHQKVRNKFTGQEEGPDELLMRSIEEKIGVPENRKNDFRQEIMNYIGALALNGRTFDFRSNKRLLQALELKLFDDHKDFIKLTAVVSPVVDKETQEKIDIIKSRLIKNFGYCEVCATDVLHFVASLFARDDKK